MDDAWEPSTTKDTYTDPLTNQTVTNLNFTTPHNIGIGYQSVKMAKLRTRERGNVRRRIVEGAATDVIAQPPGPNFTSKLAPDLAGAVKEDDSIDIISRASLLGVAPAFDNTHLPRSENFYRGRISVKSTEKLDHVRSSTQDFDSNLLHHRLVPK